MKSVSGGTPLQHFIASTIQRLLDIRLGLGQAHDLARVLPLTTLLEQFDPLESFQDVALGGDGAGAFETAMLRLKFAPGFPGGRVVLRK